MATTTIGKGWELTTDEDGMLLVTFADGRIHWFDEGEEAEAAAFADGLVAEEAAEEARAAEAEDLAGRLSGASVEDLAKVKALMEFLGL